MYFCDVVVYFYSNEVALQSLSSSMCRENLSRSMRTDRLKSLSPSKGVQDVDIISGRWSGTLEGIFETPELYIMLNSSLM